VLQRPQPALRAAAHVEHRRAGGQLDRLEQAGRRGLPGLRLQLQPVGTVGMGGEQVVHAAMLPRAGAPAQRVCPATVPGRRAARRALRRPPTRRRGAGGWAAGKPGGTVATSPQTAAHRIHHEPP
jgi:hypothetical protein